MFQLLFVPLQNDLCFFQHPLPAIPSVFLADTLAFTRRRDVGFTMFGCDDMNDLAPAYAPAVFVVRVSALNARTPDCLPFGWSLSASLAPFSLRHLWRFTFVGPFIQPCPSDRIDACSRRSPLAAASSSCRWWDVVSAASDLTVTGRAGADRLLRTEPKVRLMSLLLISNHHSDHFHLARSAFRTTGV